MLVVVFFRVVFFAAIFSVNHFLFSHSFQIRVIDTFTFQNQFSSTLNDKNKFCVLYIELWSLCDFFFFFFINSMVMVIEFKLSSHPSASFRRRRYCCFSRGRRIFSSCCFVLSFTVIYSLFLSDFYRSKSNLLLSITQDVWIISDPLFNCAYIFRLFDEIFFLFWCSEQHGRWKRACKQTWIRNMIPHYQPIWSVIRSKLILILFVCSIYFRYGLLLRLLQLLMLVDVVVVMCSVLYRYSHARKTCK